MTGGGVGETGRHCTPLNHPQHVRPCHWVLRQLSVLINAPRCAANRATAPSSNRLYPLLAEECVPEKIRLPSRRSALRPKNEACFSIRFPTSLIALVGCGCGPKVRKQFRSARRTYSY